LLNIREIFNPNFINTFFFQFHYHLQINVMKTKKRILQNGLPEVAGNTNYCTMFRSVRKSSSLAFVILISVLLSSMFAQCRKDLPGTVIPTDPDAKAQYTIIQAISDQAQKYTISFDGLAFLTGCVGAQSFIPPGKVADYSGFQYLRDNDPTNMGHNTSFVTIISNNILSILNSDQINMFVQRAQSQIDSINAFAYKRYPLLEAFRRLQQGTFPVGTTQLSENAVKTYAGSLYETDGQISYSRYQLFGAVVNSLTAAQKTKLAALKALNGIGHWDSTLVNPLQTLNLHLSQDMGVAVMTYASEMYAWYVGDVYSDTYFCPERHGTYFGSFYLKDWPAMGNPNYTIDETLTGNAGQNFLGVLTTAQAAQVSGIVNLQRTALDNIVAKRTAIATELRKFYTGNTADLSTVLSLSENYGELDGELSYLYATTFSKVYNLLTADQKAKLLSLVNQLGYVTPTGGFLYSQPIPMPAIENTDFMFK